MYSEYIIHMFEKYHNTKVITHDFNCIYRNHNSEVLKSSKSVNYIRQKENKTQSNVFKNFLFLFFLFIVGIAFLLLFSFPSLFIHFIDGRGKEHET